MGGAFSRTVTFHLAPSLGVQSTSCDVERCLTALFLFSRRLMPHFTPALRPMYALLALALAGPALAASPSIAYADGGDRVQAKATFALVWERLQNSGFKGQHEGLDWAALKAEHQPQIEAARDIESLRRKINELLADLKASHLVLLPAETMADAAEDIAEPDALGGSKQETKQHSNDDDADAVAQDGFADEAADTGLGKTGEGFGDLGIRLALFSGRVHVERVVEGSAAQQAGVRPGWALDRIGRFDVRTAAKALSEQPGDARHRGESLLLSAVQALLEERAPGQRVKLQFRNRAEKAHALTLIPQPSAEIESLTLPGIPPIPLRYAQHRLTLPDGDCALHVEFSQWAMPVFDKLVESLREHGDCKGVVIDLRGNSGGQVVALSALGGLFLDQQASLGTLTTGGGDLKLTAIPRIVDNAGRDIRRFSGPLAILIDSASVSCSDIFPASMQALKRARIFGSRSAGMALPAASTPLPSGDRLLYPIADFVDPIGRRIEGTGVIPDEVVVPTVDALSTGRDPVLDAALAWFGSDAKPAARAATALSTPAH
jgi:carboxyl-terminal processing protease